MSKFINKKGLILMISTILVGSSVVAIAAACNNKTSQPSKQKQTNTQQSSSSTTKTTTKKEDKMNSGSTNNNPSSSKTNEGTNNSSLVNKTNDKTGSAADKTMENKPTKPAVKQSESPTQTTPKTDGKTNIESKQMSDAPSTPKAENGKQQADSATGTAKLDASDAQVTIYSGTKISKESENKYILHVYIKNADNKYAQLVLKPKEGGAEITSSFEKIISGYVAVYFKSVEPKKNYNVIAVKISDNSDGSKPKAAKVFEDLKKVNLTLKEEEKLF
ncbi:Vmc-like lipoprotein signal peptide domain-containing protein [Ureaplasma diversum]|uniref:Lipoprotein n=1 Tax=Ureaplasma diversum NCTC 246 TaxID=1188241 RepID=A0A084EXG8_9BACT|nr:hypothetical protein [Ureaplasma diversum]KEZ22660.1 Hypothetical protein, predicted lipoprotein [Ureaplasma diversum NCTC 246]